MTLTKFKPSTHVLRDVFSPMGFDSLMSNFFTDNADMHAGNSFFRPTVDVVENEDNYDVHVSVPGVKKEDISIDLKGNELTVSGERQQRTENKTSTCHVGEIRYGKFSRTFFLPEQVDQDKIEAKFKDGMLHVSIPKVEKAKPRTISIK